MNFSRFSLILTDDCNFDCSYCRQQKEKLYMQRSTIDKSLSFFYPFLADEAYIVFYGGEPLLAYDNIQYAVSLMNEINIKKKKITYSISTNGSLLTPQMLEYFNTHEFTILLSFDSITQDTTRRAGSSQKTLAQLRDIISGKYPNIDFITNGVFTPKSVGHLSDSLKFLVGEGAGKIVYSLANDQPWEPEAISTLEQELDKTIDFLSAHYETHNTFPVQNFSDPQNKKNSSILTKKDDTGKFVCGGGSQRMAVTPAGNLLGCSLFQCYFQNKPDNREEYRTYSFGKLEDFIKDHETIYPRVLANYSMLRQACFYTDKKFCFSCQDVGICQVCPISSALATGVMGKLPPWMCHLQNIKVEKRKKFQAKIKK